MLREASVSELRGGDIPKAQRVLVNRGRGNDELAPADELYGDFEAAKARLEGEHGKGSAEAHNAAFLESGYERRFRDQIAGDPAALARLEEIAARAAAEDVFLVCYEGPPKACHRRILLRVAEERFGAAVAVEGVEPRP
jgi:hypothetical protein